MSHPRPTLRDELRQLREWGIRRRSQAADANIEWPPNGAEAQYRDIWTWEGDVHQEWGELIAARYPTVHSVIDTARHIHDAGRRRNQSSLAAYLTFMAVRLIEMHRVLKPTGSLFLHCDHTANSYLRMLLDAIFGRDALKNEIAWCYTGPSNTKRWFPRKHDTILWYARDAEWTFNRDAVRVPYKKHETGQTSGIFKQAATLDAAGKVVEDWWADITTVGRLQHELTGYPTQKPVLLAERIISAASKPGDLVFDPFAGCAYVPVAAELLGRRWVACDISPRAMTIIKRQFSKEWDPGTPREQQLDMRDERAKVTLDFSRVRVIGPADLPQRTTDDPPVPPPPTLPEVTEFKRPSPTMPEREQKRVLARLSNWAD